MLKTYWPITQKMKYLHILVIIIHYRAYSPLLAQGVVSWAPQWCRVSLPIGFPQFWNYNVALNIPEWPKSWGSVRLDNILSSNSKACPAGYENLETVDHYFSSSTFIWHPTWFMNECKESATVGSLEKVILIEKSYWVNLLKF